MICTGSTCPLKTGDLVRERLELDARIAALLTQWDLHYDNQAGSQQEDGA